MRRARIKAQAIVPVRRKALQEAQSKDTNEANSSTTTITDVGKTYPESNPEVSERRIDTLKESEVSEHNVERTQESEKILESSTNNKELSINDPVKRTDVDEIAKKNNYRKNEFMLSNSRIENTQNIERKIDLSSNEDRNNSQTVQQIDYVLENDEVNDSSTDQRSTEEYCKDSKSETVKIDNDTLSKNETRDIIITQTEGSYTKQVLHRSCFMRPVPKLSNGGRIRKNSIQGSGASASESEDDSKKSILSRRTRNDSIQSVQNTEDISGSGHSLSKFKLGQPKRRLTVSESARKLAEARREFMLKHENKPPDRNKLTMYDLIYYNPTSNPMTSNQASDLTKRSIISSLPDKSMKDEKEKKKKEEEAVMPVPQVKVGPNGQLIIDEKSLVIERTEAERSNAEPIIHDENSGGGFYKRRQKSKDWTKLDTLKFYRVLSHIGPDFLLMQSFFPNRTRQELKLKYKKEEKTNKTLIEKALKCQVFDMDILKEEMVMFEETEKREVEIAKTKLETVKKLKTSKARPKCRFVVSSIEEIENSCEEDDVDIVQSSKEKEENLQRKLKLLRKRRGLNTSKNRNDVREDSNSDVEDSQVYTVRTRSGRLSKRRKLLTPDTSSSSEEPSDSEGRKSIVKTSRTLLPANTHTESHLQSEEVLASLLPDAANIEPGSLVILTKESPGEPTKTVVQVYMVSKNYNQDDPSAERNMTPVNLSPELLATVNSKILESKPVKVRIKNSNQEE